MEKYAATFDAVVLGNGGSLTPLCEMLELIEANGKARQAEMLNRQRHLQKSRSYSDLMSTLEGDGKSN